MYFFAKFEIGLTSGGECDIVIKDFEKRIELSIVLYYVYCYEYIHRYMYNYYSIS